MNAVRNFFSSLKEDLLGKRLLPYLLVLGVALVAAVGYAVLGGGSSAPAPTAVTASVPAGASAAVGDVTVSQAPANPNEPISETTEGTSKQHHGVAHDPFTPLPEPKQAAAPSTPSSTSSSSSASTTPSAGSTPSAPSSGGTTPTTPKETTPAKPKVYVHFHVTAQLGVVPVVAEGAPAQPAQLKTYKDMALDEPLPDKANPQLVFLGVVLRTGKEALFGLTGAAILHGSGSCQPSATQCQAIDLQVGQSETLEVRRSRRQHGHLRTEAREHRQEHEHRLDGARPRRLPRPGEGRARTRAPGAEALGAALLALGRRLRVRRPSGVRRPICDRSRSRRAPALTLSLALPSELSRGRRARVRPRGNGSPTPSK